MCLSMRYPSPEGWVEVSREYVEGHWQGKEVKDVVPKDRINKKWSTRDLEKRQFAFTVVVELIRNGWLDCTNQPTAEAVNKTKEKCSVDTMDNLIKIKNKFQSSPMTTSSPPTPTPTPTTTITTAPTPTPTPTQTTTAKSSHPSSQKVPSHFKSRLQEKSQAQLLPLPKYSTCAEQGGFRATVVVTTSTSKREYRGDLFMRKKDAEQDAARKALS